MDTPCLKHYCIPLGSGSTEEPPLCKSLFTLMSLLFVSHVTRHWQDLGYLIMYITARPDMQKKKVVAWLAQHNFPHGMVVFMDGLSADPLKQKTNYIKHLTQEVSL